MKENLDDILKRKLKEQHFSIDEGHRMAMIELLDKNKRRKVFPFYWMGGIVLLVSGAVYLLLANHENEIPFQKQNSSDVSTTAIDSKPDNASGNENSIPISNTEKNVIQSSEVNHLQSLNTTIRSKIEGKASPRVSIIHNQPASPTSIEQNHGKATGTINSEGQSIVPTIQPSIDPSKSYPQAVSKENALEFQQKNILGGETLEPNISELNPIELIPVLTNLRTVTSSPFLDPIPVSEIRYRTGFLLDPVQPHFTSWSPWYIFAEAGAGVAQGDKQLYSSGRKLRAGAGLGYTLNSKLDLTWSAGYLMQDEGFDFQRSSTVQRPGFGLRSDFNSITPERLHHVYSKLGIQYRIYRHLFAVHGGVQYLYGAEGQISVVTQDQFQTEDIETTRYTWVKPDGLRRFLGLVDLAYGYQLTPRISVLAGAEFYLSSLTVKDPALSQEGFYWRGNFSSIHPFINLNYRIYDHR